MLLRTQNELKLDPGNIGGDSAILLTFRQEGWDYIEGARFSWKDGADNLAAKLKAEGYTVNTLPDRLSLQGNALEAYIYGNSYKAVGSPSELEALDMLLKSNPMPPPPKVDGVYNIVFRHMYINRFDDLDDVGYRFTNQSEHLADLKSEMYPKVDVTKMMEMYTQSSESVLILTGEPGTGKTCFTKMLCKSMSEIQKSDLNIVYVKDPELLKRDTFWISLQRQDPDLLILDDLDDELKPRIEGKNEIMNHMLSFSDGIFPKKTKIIITTNQPNSAIDTAIVRPGRCFDVLALPQLTPAEGVDIWVNTFGRTEESFVKTFGDLDGGWKVSQAALVSESSRLEITERTSYLKDPSISIRTLVETGETVN